MTIEAVSVLEDETFNLMLRGLIAEVNRLLTNSGNLSKFKKSLVVFEDFPRGDFSHAVTLEVKDIDRISKEVTEDDVLAKGPEIYNKARVILPRVKFKTIILVNSRIISVSMNPISLAGLLIHETIHVTQILKKHLVFISPEVSVWKGKRYNTKNISLLEYFQLPWEVEAYQTQAKFLSTFRDSSPKEIYNNMLKAYINLDLVPKEF